MAATENRKSKVHRIKHLLSNTCKYIVLITFKWRHLIRLNKSPIKTQYLQTYTDIGEVTLKYSILI